MNKSQYGSNMHSLPPQWNHGSVPDRWSSAVGSSTDSRSRGQSSMSSSMLSGTGSIANLFGSNPIAPGLGLGMNHPLQSSNLGGGDRSYLHGNRRF